MARSTERPTCKTCPYFRPNDLNANYSPCNGRCQLEPVWIPKQSDEVCSHHPAMAKYLAEAKDDEPKMVYCSWCGELFNRDHAPFLVGGDPPLYFHTTECYRRYTQPRSTGQPKSGLTWESYNR